MAEIVMSNVILDDHIDMILPKTWTVELHDSGMFCCEDKNDPNATLWFEELVFPRGEAKVTAMELACRGVGQHVARLVDEPFEALEVEFLNDEILVYEQLALDKGEERNLHMSWRRHLPREDRLQIWNFTLVIDRDLRHDPYYTFLSRLIGAAACGAEDLLYKTLSTAIN